MKHLIISAHGKADSRHYLDVRKLETRIYYEVINSIRTLGALVTDSNLGGMLSDAMRTEIYRDCMIHVELRDPDAEPFIELMCARHPDMKIEEYDI